MSVAYDMYLKDHVTNVKRAFDWMADHDIFAPKSDILTADRIKEIVRRQISYHDASKWESTEYDAYDDYFYGTEKTEEVKEDFNYAWLHHIHKNDHHWQHWVLLQDDDSDKPIGLEMIITDVYEMIADWWSFSFKDGDLYEIFNWYADHSDKMILHKNTRKDVDDILDRIQKALDKEKEQESEGQTLAQET